MEVLFMRSRVEIKAEAKDVLRSARVNPLVFSAIFIVILFVLDRIVDLVETGAPFFSLYVNQLDYEPYYNDLVNGNYGDIMSQLHITPQGTFFSILVGLFTTVLYGGYYIYSMGIRQGLKMPYATILDGLSAAGKLILCDILVSIKVILWALLFVIPGIIAAYRYRFAEYNLLTDDSLSVSQAIRLSCQQTQGMKGDLFVLDLSFIGWTLLASITFGILTIYVLPYYISCELAYFEIAQQNLGRQPYGGSSQPNEWL